MNSLTEYLPLMFFIILTARAATFIYLVPSFTANLDHMFFGAVFTIPMVTGTTMVVIGLLLGNINLRQIEYIKKIIRFKKPGQPA